MFATRCDTWRVCIFLLLATKYDISLSLIILSRGSAAIACSSLPCINKRLRHNN